MENVGAMKIAALSDFHIGPWDRGDVFRHTEATFLRFLDGLERTHDLIVVLGDVYQTQWAAVWSETMQALHLLQARMRFPRLAARLDGPGYVVLAGNHDEVARRELGAPLSFEVEADGHRVLFAHGHQYDEVMNRHLRAAQASTWLMGWARRVGLVRMAEMAEHWDVQVKHKFYAKHGSPYFRAARRLAAERGADVVCFGHTHVPELRRGEGFLLVNPGACLGGRFSYVSLDLENGLAVLHAPGVMRQERLPGMSEEDSRTGPFARLVLGWGGAGTGDDQRRPAEM